MYDRAFTQRAIDEVSRAQGWELRPKAVWEIDEAIDHFDELRDPETKNLRRPLTKEEIRFIQNERKLCAIDFLYWSSRFAYITNWAKQEVRFTPNVAQRMILDIWSEIEAKQFAIMMMNLKARQLGCSTLSELAVAHRVQFAPRTTAVVASADPKKTVAMGLMIRFCWERQPWWLMPEPTRHEKGMPVEFGEIDTSILIQAGNMFHGVARGQTPNVAHLCLAPQSLVRVADGAVKPISEVQRGDRIITAEGRMVSVLAQAKSPRRSELTARLWVWGTFVPLECTRDHLVLSDKGWRKASEFKAGDWIHYPVKPITSQRKQSSYLKLARGGDPYRSRPSTTMPLPLTSTFGYVIGLYLAEGSLLIQTRPGKKQTSREPSGVAFSIDSDEVDPVTKRLDQAGWTGSAIRRSNSRTVVIAHYNSGIGRWFRDEIGEKDGKRIPDWVWQCGPSFASAVVQGYLDGDGHFTEGNEIYATSVRLQLLTSVRELIASLGCGWGSITYRDAGLYYGRNCRATWTLVICGESGRRVRHLFGYSTTNKVRSQDNHWKYNNDNFGHLCLEVESVGDGFSDDFYDIEVDDLTSSFTCLQGTVHNSELSSWLNAEEDVDASMMHAIHPTPDVFVMLESTALGRDNWWYDTWQYAKVEYPRGRSQLCPMFLPWFVGTDIWPTSDDLRARPVPPNWVPSERTLQHAVRAREYVLANPLLLKHLAKGSTDWHLPREQMWFYEIEREKAIAKKSLNKFLSEMPSSDLEAFQNTNISLVDQDVLINYRERVRQPEGVYAIVGPGIHPSLVPPRHTWDMTQPAITVRVAEVVRSTEVFQFIPLKFDGYTAYDPMLKLFIWEMPQPGQTYGVGVDTSDGIGQDRSVIEVLRKATDETGHGQVAEFASDYIKSNQLWPMALAVSAFYSTWNPRAQRRTQCRVAVECLGNGEIVQSELQKRGWINFHPWKKYDNRKPTPDNQAQKLGVFTNVWFRSMMMDTLLSVVDEEWLAIWSPWLIDELGTLERDPDQRSARAASNAHDDRIMALGFTLFSLTIDDRPNQRAQRRVPQYLPEALEDGPQESYATWQPPAQARSQGLVRGVPLVGRAQQRFGAFDRYINMNLPRRYR